MYSAPFQPHPLMFAVQNPNCKVSVPNMQYGIQLIPAGYYPPHPASYFPITAQSSTKNFASATAPPCAPPGFSAHVSAVPGFGPCDPNTGYNPTLMNHTPHINYVSPQKRVATTSPQPKKPVTPSQIITVDLSKHSSEKSQWLFRIAVKRRGNLADIDLKRLNGAQVCQLSEVLFGCKDNCKNRTESNRVLESNHTPPVKKMKHSGVRCDISLPGYEYAVKNLEMGSDFEAAAPRQIISRFPVGFQPNQSSDMSRQHPQMNALARLDCNVLHSQTPQRVLEPCNPRIEGEIYQMHPASLVPDSQRRASLDSFQEYRPDLSPDSPGSPASSYSDMDDEYIAVVGAEYKHMAQPKPISPPHWTFGLPKEAHPDIWTRPMVNPMVRA